ncbi:hypothetical protein KGF54_001810 [Candida jiufengensis]|uniref:uncharacterized protein n=1 Tax=Candida jiufengensis TaxID=497108 RepID=UPI002224FB6A|nr:uncharacterized protein KGF54_001810 [Candida jiufengensis]KAI5955249.1 hypothetical protein KGF54_001810 [Candida jiufengensis]
MIKKDPPPSYTNKSTYFIDKKDQPPPFEEHILGDEPVYFKDASTRGWTVVINNRSWTDNFRIFVSKDSSEKFDAFKNNTTDSNVMDLKRQGVGIPLLKVLVPHNPITTKFLTFRRYYPNPDGPFDIDKHFYEFCTVKKHYHIGYDSYVFDFKPDKDTDKGNFQITMFSHSRFPVHDYMYNGERHRWIDETFIDYFKKLFQVKFGFKHTILVPDQPSLCDNWDGKSHKLDKTKENPFLASFLKQKFNFKTRVPKPEYYGTRCSAILGEPEAYFKLGFAEVRIDDLYNTESDVNYDSILSINQDALVLICIATVLKRQKDIIEDRQEAEVML